jgi:hypothetical protein
MKTQGIKFLLLWFLCAHRAYCLGCDWRFPQHAQELTLPDGQSCQRSDKAEFLNVAGSLDRIIKEE